MKNYTDIDYSNMAIQANVEHKKLIIAQKEEKRPIYDDDGNIIDYYTVKIESLELVDNPENFDRCFFNTSLGYVRRKPFIKGTGEYKDFLSDISAGLVVGQPIITYTKDLEQNVVLVTEQFKQECLAQYNKDFNGEAAANT